MSARIHLLAQALLGKDSLQPSDTDAVRALVEKYPYCAPARFLLVQQLAAESAPDYGSELGKAVLYYHHPVQLAGLLQQERFLVPLQESISSPAGQEIAVEEEEEPQPSLSTPEVAEEPLSAPIVEAMEERPEAAPAPEEAITPLAEQAPEPAPAQKAEELAFEPFHTVDYFASQGIKLSQEEVGKDRFGRQLKSFTEWLKTMKRLPQPDASTPLDSTSEQQVAALANQSVSSGDVLTEAMAEVWLKQGNRERAREVYRKLSLLHPGKSAYFAAKLDQIQS